MTSDFTILCTLDASHIEELRISYATWRRHKPSTMQRPLMVICDLWTAPVDPCGDWWRGQLSFLADHPGGVTFKFTHRGDDWPVRERMVSAFVFAAKHIETRWYLKLDADTCATGNDKWIDDRWFKNEATKIVASPWGYSRPASQLAEFARWSDQHPGCFHRPMPEYVIGALGSKAFHRRMISYCQFGRTDWTAEMAQLAGGRLPIPSQDGFLSLCAARNGAETRYVKMKNLGWQHVGGGGRRLREAAAAAMELPQT